MTMWIVQAPIRLYTHNVSHMSPLLWNDMATTNTGGELWYDSTPVRPRGHPQPPAPPTAAQRTFGVDPARVQVGKRGLIGPLLNGLRGFRIYYRAGTASPGSVRHVAGRDGAGDEKGRNFERLRWGALKACYVDRNVDVGA